MITFSSIRNGGEYLFLPNGTSRTSCICFNFMQAKLLACFVFCMNCRKRGKSSFSRSWSSRNRMNVYCHFWYMIVLSNDPLPLNDSSPNEIFCPHTFMPFIIGNFSKQLFIIQFILGEIVSSEKCELLVICSMASSYSSALK